MDIEFLTSPATAAALPLSFQARGSISLMTRIVLYLKTTVNRQLSIVN